MSHVLGATSSPAGPRLHPEGSRPVSSRRRTAGRAGPCPRTRASISPSFSSSGPRGRPSGGMVPRVASKPPAFLSSDKEDTFSQLSSATDPGPDFSIVQRNLALEVVRVTEAAALAAGKWQGKGDKNAADQAAVDQMRKVLNTIKMDGTIVIGEGEKDEAPMLYCGERVGDGSSPSVDIAVDPLDGTTLTATGREGAIAVIAIAEKGALFDPGPCMYMEKLAVGPEVLPHSVSLSYPVLRNLQAVAEAQRKAVSEVTVVILDRPRHADLIQEVRNAGARIKLISDGDVAAAIEVARPDTSVDIMLGTGGTPEGVITAAAMKCMGGTLQGRLAPRNEEERRTALELGYDLDRILFVEDLCKGSQVKLADLEIHYGSGMAWPCLFSFTVRHTHAVTPGVSAHN
mmetsp:Transcript_39421/g.111723  ORF Transcript_39421/g.111723 Transcript_39421/m.111723 type:complete len:401 (+) Transcript_39421:165-1367(+)